MGLTGSVPGPARARASGFQCSRFCEVREQDPSESGQSESDPSESVQSESGPSELVQTVTSVGGGACVADWRSQGPS